MEQEPKSKRPMWDYLFFDKKLPHKPEVLRIAAETGMSRREVFAALLEFWVWVDDHYPDGFLAGADVRILSAVCPGTCPDFWRIVSAVGWIVVRADGIEIPNAERWFGKTAKRRAQEALRKWNNRHNDTDCPPEMRTPCGHDADIVRTQSAPDPIPIPNPNTKTKRTPQPPSGECLTSFDAFWIAYPRKTNKAGALKSWVRVNPDAALRETIFAAVRLWSQTEQWRRGVVPHATTWLNQHRWEDEVPKEQSHGHGPGVGSNSRVHTGDFTNLGTVVSGDLAPPPDANAGGEPADP